jgi:hypothetical protein
MQPRKVEKIVETAMFELNKRFEYARIGFITENVNDIRMKHILKNKTSILIPALNSQPDPDREEEFNFYIENIYRKDFQLNRGHRFIHRPPSRIFSAS